MGNMMGKNTGQHLMHPNISHRTGRSPAVLAATGPRNILWLGDPPCGSTHLRFVRLDPWFLGKANPWFLRPTTKIGHSPVSWT